MNDLSGAKSVKDKDMRKMLVTLVSEHGHNVVLTRNGHVRVLHRDGQGQVVMAGTPSDYRSFKNAVAQMRRAGFEV